MYEDTRKEPRIIEGIISDEDYDDTIAIMEILEAKIEADRRKERTALERLYLVFWIMHTDQHPKLVVEKLMETAADLCRNLHRKMTNAQCGDWIRVLKHLDNETYISQLPANLVEVIAHYTELTASLPTATEFFVNQRSDIWFLLRSQISKEYPTESKRVTGSILASLLGCNRHGPTPYDIWRAWTGQLRPGEVLKFDGNDDTKYGVRYEKRDFLIFARMVAAGVREPGFYTHNEIEYLGVSPDGVLGNILILVTNAVADKLGNRDPPSPDGKRWIELGEGVLELKTTRYGHGGVKLEHVFQVLLEMFVPSKSHAWLQYWHADEVDLYLFPEFDPVVWQWVTARVERFLHFVITRTEPDEDCRKVIAFELADEWFPKKPQYKSQWSRDKIHLKPPRKPKILKMLHTDKPRGAPFEDTEFLGKKIYPVDLEQNDPWYTTAWQPLHREQEASECEFRIYGIQETK